MKTNVDDLDWDTYENDETTFRRKELSNAAGGEQLGCSLYELPPGERSWPYHYHTANEEAIYVLSGDGLLKRPDGKEPLATGDFAVFPADESGGHRVINDGDETLRYLAVSTMNEPDITRYPEKGSFGVFVGSPPGGREERSFEGYFPEDAETEYWE
jgi:uncharacterized cupin superfamily protein